MGIAFFVLIASVHSSLAASLQPLQLCNEIAVG
jgi:hypothetical protein